MTLPAAAALPPAAPATPAPVRVVSSSSHGFSGIAALGGVLAGFLSHGRNPDLLTTAIAAGATFLGALIALHVLHFVFRVAVLCAKVAVPLGVILLVGCAMHWPWAEVAVDWLRAMASQGAALAENGLAALRAR